MSAEVPTPEERKAKAEEVQKKKDNLIKKAYYDGAGYNSQAITLRDVRKTDKTITKDYIQDWFDANVL